LKIWDLSDQTAKGFLTKQGFFVALKLIALAQTGREISMLNITQQTTPPNMVKVKLLTNCIKIILDNYLYYRAKHQNI